MLQEKTAKYFLKYRHDGHTSHLTGRNKNMGWSKRLRDSILSPIFHSYIFAIYKNESLWI